MKNEEKLTKKQEKIFELKSELSGIVEKILDAPDSEREKLARRRVEMQEEIDLIGLEIQVIKNRIVEDRKKENLKQIETLKSKVSALQKEHAGYMVKLNQGLERRHENSHKGVYIPGTLEPVPTREAIAIVANDAYETSLYTSLCGVCNTEISAIRQQIQEVQSRL